MKSEVTTRFLLAMSDIIARHRREGGKCRNVKAFAETIDAVYNNFTHYGNPDSGRNVTVDNCVMIGVVHGVDMNWLMLGEGQMYRTNVSKTSPKPENGK